MSKGGESKVRIPKVLLPLAKAGVSTGTNTLASLEAMLGNAGGADLVAGFTPEQQIAQYLTTQRALDPDSVFGTSRNTLTDAAGGMDLSSFISPDVLNSLSNRSAIPSGILDRLGGGELSGASILSGFTESGLPDMSGTGSSLESILNRNPTGDLTASAIPQTAVDALTRTASGDYLYGGEGFDRDWETLIL